MRKVEVKVRRLRKYRVIQSLYKDAVGVSRKILDRLVPIASLCLCCAFPAYGIERAARESPAVEANPAQNANLPRCLVQGGRKITITCDYKPIPVDSRPATGSAAIALNHAELAFETRDDNWMSLELRFTRLDSTPTSEAHLVYIAIDDEFGNNYIRRPLPDVNLSGLEPGLSTEFKERLILPALRPGHYQIKLWMPSAEPMNRFEAAHNLLVSSFGVADEKLRLNTIAAFVVER
jgi:hypothetical protein